MRYDFETELKDKFVIEYSFSLDDFIVKSVEESVNSNRKLFLESMTPDNVIIEICADEKTAYEECKLWREKERRNA